MDPLAVGATCGALVVLVALLLVAERRGSRRGVWVLKPASSAAFVALAVLLDAWATGYGQLVLVGLVLSWWGDVLLIPRSDVAFRLGLASFLLAHVAYAAAFLSLGVAWAGAAAGLLLLAPFGLAVARWLLPRVPRRLLAPVVAYMLVITAMVAFATGAVAAGASPWLLVAAVGFYLSDLTVARDRFVEPGFPNKLVGWPLYFAAQAGFALTIGLAR